MGLLLMVRMLMIMRAVLSGMFMAVGTFPLFMYVRVTMLMDVPMGMGVLVFMSVPLAVVVVRVRMDVFVFMLMGMVDLHRFFPLSWSWYSTSW